MFWHLFMSRRNRRRPHDCGDEENPPPAPQHLLITVDPIVIEHRYPPPLPEVKIQFVDKEIGKQTDLPQEIKQILQQETMNITIKADEFAKFAIVGKKTGGAPHPIDEEEAIRNLVEEGSIRVVVAPTRGPNNERFIFFVPSSQGTNTGRTIVDAEPGAGQTFKEHAWTVTVTAPTTPADEVDLVNVETGKQSALPDEIKQILAETTPTPEP